ncbi:MAG TPA: hypothetical protein VK968_05105, partial [Roseimicrobium sp.]|nr:hypothetical protein [Roseimicrobium sp.]
MTIWLLALLFVALGCGFGRNLGAIRVLIGTFGVVVAANLALPMSSMLKGPLGSIGITNPLVRLSLPPILVIIVFIILFNVIAQVVHQQISMYYRYKVEDDHRISWERLNEKLGVALGG